MARSCPALDLSSCSLLLGSAVLSTVFFPWDQSAAAVNFGVANEWTAQVTRVDAQTKRGGSPRPSLLSFPSHLSLPPSSPPTMLFRFATAALAVLLASSACDASLVTLAARNKGVPTAQIKNGTIQGIRLPTFSQEGALLAVLLFARIAF